MPCDVGVGGFSWITFCLSFGHCSGYRSRTSLPGCSLHRSTEAAQTVPQARKQCKPIYHCQALSLTCRKGMCKNQPSVVHRQSRGTDSRASVPELANIRTAVLAKRPCIYTLSTCFPVLPALDSRANQSPGMVLQQRSTKDDDMVCELGPEWFHDASWNDLPKLDYRPLRRANDRCKQITMSLTTRYQHTLSFTAMPKETCKKQFFTLELDSCKKSS